jgi:hypothetical protein
LQAKSIWLSFTPEVTGTFDFSLCGSRVSANLIGYTGAACGPYASTGLCFQNPAIQGQAIDSVPADCSTGRKISVPLNAGTTIRLLVFPYYTADFGPVTLTVTQSVPLKPLVTSVSPAVGSAAGGAKVVISGTGFVTGTSVMFGSTAATSVTVLTPNVLTATAPAGTPGMSTVTVQIPGGSASTLANAFVYQKVASTPRHRAAKP